MNRIDRYDLDCGAVLLVEPTATMKSVGLTILTPVGSSCDREGQIGASSILGEWIWRGSGGLDSRAHSETLDRYGAQRSSNLGTDHLRAGVSMIGSRLFDALPYITSMFTAPALDDATFEPVRDLSLQALAGLQDEPQQRSMLRVKELQFPAPFNRSGLGREEDLESLTPEQCRALWRERALPGGTIIGACGDVDGADLARRLNTLFNGWSGAAVEPREQAPPARGNHHEDEDSAQVHIGVACDAPPEPDDNSVLCRVANAALSGGMSGRLFTEVREKRSLCYSVYSSYAAGRDRGAMLAYSGTTPERAQETLDVLIGELRRMRQGIEPGEFARAIVGLKSRLVMQGESTAARAGAIAHDLFVLGRPRTLDELAAIIDSVTIDDVNRYLRERPMDDFTIVTIGKTPLTAPTAS